MKLKAKMGTMATIALVGLTGIAAAAGFDELLVTGAGTLETRVSNESIPVPGIPADNSGEKKRAIPLEWITIPGGRFTMGSNGLESGFEDAMPAREVAIRNLQMTKTAVTVSQYAECVRQGACTEPSTSDYCNWGVPDRGNHPVNCVSWRQAQQFAEFHGARLPSESEWEYAARSGGKNQKYPWGNVEPNCGLAVMTDYNGYGYGCGANGTMPVCSKPAGNTAQGLCDMAGNVWEWVQDRYQDSYKGVPADGRPFEASGYYRVLRGGAFTIGGAEYMRAGKRGYSDPGYGREDFGFRLAR